MLFFPLMLIKFTKLSIQLICCCLVYSCVNITFLLYLKNIFDLPVDRKSRKFIQLILCYNYPIKYEFYIIKYTYRVLSLCLLSLLMTLKPFLINDRRVLSFFSFGQVMLPCFQWGFTITLNQRQNVFLFQYVS